MRLEILPSAWDDLAEGFRFYAEREAGLGDYFIETMISDLDRLPASAGSHRSVFGFHRTLARRFPFAIYYSVKGDVVLVRAVLDCRRAPGWHRKKLA